MTRPESPRRPPYPNRGTAASSLSVALKRVRRLSKHRRWLEAYEQAAFEAEAMSWRGRPVEALAVISTTRELVPSAERDPEIEGRILHAEAVAFSALGRDAEAEDAFEGLRLFAKARHDTRLEGTAMFGHGTLLHRLGRHEQAIKKYGAAYTCATRAKDLSLRLEILLNVSSLLADQGKEEPTKNAKAEDLLDALEPLLDRGGDPDVRWMVDGIRAHLARNRRKFPEAEALYRRTLRSARQAKNVFKELRSLQNLCAVLADQGRPADAIRWYRRGLSIAQDPALARAREPLELGLAGVYFRAGNTRKAYEYFLTAQATAERLGDTLQWARTTAEVGAVELLLGETAKAHQSLERALAPLMAAGDHEWVGRVVGNQVQLARSEGDAKKTAAAVEGALLHLPPGALVQRADLLRLAAVDLVQARLFEDGVKTLERSISERTRLNDPNLVAWEEVQAGTLLADGRRPDLAVPFYSRSYRAYARLADGDMARAVLADRANAYTNLEQYPLASRDYRTCIAQSEKVRDRVMLARTLANYGESLRRQGRHPEALKALRRALRLAHRLNDVQQEAHALSLMGITFNGRERWQEAEAAFRQALTLAPRDPVLRGSVLGGLACAAFGRKEYREAIRLYRRAVEYYAKHGEVVHRLEDLCSLTAVSAALKDERGLEGAMQQVFDLATATDQHDIASMRLTTVGDQLLREGDRENAADVYAVAILLAVTAGSDPRQVIAKTVGVLMTIVMTISFTTDVAQDAPLAKMRARLHEYLGSPGTDAGNFLAETFDLVTAMVEREKRSLLKELTATVQTKSKRRRS
jgi:tetratricopeptide (TPR) repeat protein